MCRLTSIPFIVWALWVSGGAGAEEWAATTTDLIASEKPGYGGLSGVVVERTSGDLYLNVSDQGIYRSGDQGKSWKRLGEGIKGRTETPGCMLFDPTGKSKRFAIALVYGAPVMLSSDQGETWQTLDKKSGHVDWAAIDWTDPDAKFILTLKHESGGLLLVSHDSGKTFDEVGKGYGPVWIFDDKTAVAAEAKEKSMPGLARTTDGGKTWSACGEYAARALPKWHDGKLFWLTKNSLITTSDKGTTWAKVCDIQGGLYGPIFGKDGKHMFILTNAGIIESTDGGQAWSAVIALPKEAKGASNMTWLDYDPVRGILYTARMGTELYKLERK